MEQTSLLSTSTIFTKTKLSFLNLQPEHYHVLVLCIFEFHEKPVNLQLSSLTISHVVVDQGLKSRVANLISLTSCAVVQYSATSLY